MNQEGRFNWRAWGMIVVGLVPIGLFLAWLRLVRKLWQEQRKN